MNCITDQFPTLNYLDDHTDDLLSSIFCQDQNISTLVHVATPLPLEDESGSKDCNNKKKRKILHKDVEKLRRQEMSSLYTKLRSLLPLKNLKRKRAISDDMDEAANYIKLVEKKIKEMNNKRDRLKGLTTTKSTVSLDHKRRESSCPTNVTVTKCCLGVEVTLLMDPYLPLSKVLKILVEDGLVVISCVSARANEMFFYTIHLEVSNLQNIDLPSLRQKLIDLSTGLQFHLFDISITDMPLYTDPSRLCIVCSSEKARARAVLPICDQ